MIKQYEPYINRAELAQKISEYVNGDGYFTEYINNEKFQDEIKKFLKVKHCFTTNNGTISLSLALLAYGIKPGDVVIVPNITMIATANAVKLIGGEPLFVDIDSCNGCLDIKESLKIIEYHSKGSREIKAVIYVTLNGRSHKITDIENFKNECKKHNVKILYDNAQSFGSYDSTCEPISCFGDGIGSFSFSMPKIITTGQGGCLVTNDDELALKITRLKDFGRECGGVDIHNYFGINSKFTEIQAIMGLCQLENIHERIHNKLKIWYWYKEELLSVRGNGVSFLYWVGFTPWFVDIYLNDSNERFKLQRYLNNLNIGTREMYPELTMQKCYYKGYSLHNSRHFALRGLWLPSSMTLKQEDVILICKKIRSFYGSK